MAIASPSLSPAHFLQQTVTLNKELSFATMTEETIVTDIPQDTPEEPKPSYVKLAMRNMVKKGGQSLWHFFLTTVGLVTFFVGMAYLTR
jgi:hypothetical protein